MPKIFLFMKHKEKEEKTVFDFEVKTVSDKASLQRIANEAARVIEEHTEWQRKKNP